MEEIKYRRSKLLVQTIPKGTLLFRLVNHPSDDVRGVPLSDGTRCITPNYNVFFFPNPFAGKVMLNVWATGFDKIRVYILKKDVKVLRLLLPAKQTRISKNTRRNFIGRCAWLSKGCLPKPLKNYDPCMGSFMIKNHPDVVGMISVAPGDLTRLQTGMKTMKQSKKKYFHLAKDALGIESIPELILHPLTTRPQKDIIVKEGDVLETNFELMKSYSFKDEDQIRSFMDKHAVYDPDTFFYTYKE